MTDKNSNTYEWSSKSAMRKLKSDITVTAGIGIVSVSKQLTPTHNPKTDAYRACSKCGKHINYHQNGKCP